MVTIKTEEQKSASQQIKEARKIIAEKEAQEKKDYKQNIRETQVNKFRVEYTNPEYIMEKQKALELFRLNALKKESEEDLEALRQGLLFYYATGHKWMKSNPDWYKAINQFILDTYKEWKKNKYLQKKTIAISKFKILAKKTNAISCLSAIEANRIMYSFAEDKVYYWPL